MHRLSATLLKEFLLLIRDKSGLAVMFLMPVALVIIMAVIQDAPFRDYQEMKIPLLLMNNDNGDLGEKIESGLTSSKIFEVTIFKGNESEAYDKVKHGDFEIGIIIPGDASEKLKLRVDQFVAETMHSMGVEVTDSIPSGKLVLNETTLSVFFAPEIKRSFRNSVLSSVRHVASKLETQTMLDAFKTALNDGHADTSHQEISEFIRFKETGGDESLSRIQLSSVQHNVPAWTLFGMFFIVISLAGSIIKERTDGTYTRIRTMPGSYMTVMAGKILAYLGVCLCQCALMLFTGIYFLPLLGLPTLIIGNSLLAILVVAICCGLAATGYGVLVGTLFQTHQQSATFGSVSVVILAALGGIWVPVYVMPEIVQSLATWSPLYWGLNAFQQVFLEGGQVTDIAPDAFKLLFFFAITISIAYLINRNKNH